MNFKETKYNVVEICCGMGGTRKAFVDAGFDVIQSIDFDKTVCNFHKEFWGDSVNLDINECSLNDISKANIISAGFPCQPFSSSGYRTGFLHEQGNVFSTLMKLTDAKNYDVVFLENVQGLFSNDQNRTFKLILLELSKRYQIVEWITFNLLSLGIPMNRPRVIILAHNENKEILNDLRKKFYHPTTNDMFPDGKKWTLENIKNDTSNNPTTGKIINGFFQEEKFELKKISFEGDLMHFLFNDKIGNFDINSGRFWGRTGKTTFYISENQFSHSIGTSMGGAPTFGINPIHITDTVLEKIKQISNYQTEHSGFFVFRTTPEDTLKFFGNRAEIFYETLQKFKAPLASKYKLIGNMFAPDQAYQVTNTLMKSLIS